MKSVKILLLEDEFQLVKIITETLINKGFEVIHLKNGKLGLEAFYQSKFDLCIVDVMMPLMDGFTFVKELRKFDQNIPVLFLTALVQDKDLIDGYDSGGNDYLKKPFSLNELCLRVNELIKRSATFTKTTSIQIGFFDFLSDRQELVSKDYPVIKLSNKESELLYLLAKNKNRLLDRKAALMKLWGDDNSFNARTMDVFITKLRKHLLIDPSIEIINIRGHGYKLLAK
jgi:DNA-binding response OmpR family regulator